MSNYRLDEGKYIRPPKGGRSNKSVIQNDVQKTPMQIRRTKMSINISMGIRCTLIIWDILDQATLH